MNLACISSESLVIFYLTDNDEVCKTTTGEISNVRGMVLNLRGPMIWSDSSDLESDAVRELELNYEKGWQGKDVIFSPN